MPWVLRLPEDVDRWLRRKAAEETISQNKHVSMNSLAVKILQKAMEEEQQRKEV